MSRYIDPVPQYFLNNGDIAADGLLDFFENLDYLTRKDTYNWNGDANSNPVVLDGSGRIPEIQADGLFSVRLRSADGVTQWTRDNVNLSTGASTPDLTSPTVIGDMTFATPGSSIVASTVDAITFASLTGVPSFPIGFKCPNVAIADPLIMDWYEEGTFTPTAYGSTSAGTATYGLRSGTYIRKGSEISGEIALTWTGHTGTGDLRISGIPNTISGYSCAGASYNMLTIGAGKNLGIYFANALTYIQLQALDPAGGAPTGIPVDANVDALIISFKYRV